MESNRRTLDDSDIVSEQSERPLPPQFKYLSATTVCLSIFALVPLLASFIILLVSPLGNTYGWGRYANEQILKLAVLMVVSLAVSIVYLSVDCPALLSIIVDGVLVSFITIKLDDFHGAYPGPSLCTPYRNFPRYPQRPGSSPPPLIYPPTGCKDWKLTLKILMGMAAGSAILIGLIFLGRVMIYLRRTRFWSRENWTIAPGTIIFTCSLKFSRPDTTESLANSGPGHGPIYI